MLQIHLFILCILYNVTFTATAGSKVVFLIHPVSCVCLATQPVAAKLLAYNRANRTVAVLCNHQRAVPKNFGQQMENLQAKVCVICLSLVYHYHLIIMLAK